MRWLLSYHEMEIAGYAKSKQSFERFCTGVADGGLQPLNFSGWD